MMQTKRPVLVRITTLPVSMKVLLKGQLAFMQKSGFEVVMVSADGKEVPSLVEQEGAKHYAIPFTRNIHPFKDMIGVWKLFLLLRKIKPDIVHTHTPKAGLIGMWAAKFAGVPVRLHTIAGLPWMEYTGVLQKILIAVEKLTASAAHAVYPNSHVQHDFLKKYGIAKGKMKVLGNGSSNGIDLSHFCLTEAIQAQAQRLRIAENIQPGDVIWIFIGRLVKDKGIAELLSAFKKIHEEFSGDRLWLLGEEEPLLDPLTPEDQKMINEYPAIRSWGFVNDVRTHLAAADVLVFPSYREGFPNVPMQAGAMGCCLLLSNINGCNEIVMQEKNGLLFPVKDAAALYSSMLRVRKNADERKDYKKNIQETIQKYSQKKLWDIILEEYKHFLSTKKRPMPVSV